MKKWIKIAVIVGLLLSIAVIYYGKNIYFQREESKVQFRLDATQIAGVPTLLELSTST